MDLLGHDVFSTLWMKEQVSHSELAHLKVAGWSSVWNELLTNSCGQLLSEKLFNSSCDHFWFCLCATFHILFAQFSFDDFVALCRESYPKIVSGPSDPLIARSEDKVTLNWTLGLPPPETWSSSIFEVIFGIWKDPGFLKKKLLVIDRHGEVLIRPNYENKISCDFNMSRLQVAFTLHNLTMKDENHYCLQVELGLHQLPLTDPVKLLLEGNIFVTFYLHGDATDPEAGGTWANMFWVCASGHSETLAHSHSLANYGPHLSHFWENAIFAIPTLYLPYKAF